MKARLPFRVLHNAQATQIMAGSLCQLAHSAVSPIGSCSLLLGAVAGGAGRWGIANFLIAAGLLLHFSVWFERWWSKNGSN
jgi:hypothetical protein